MSIAGFTFRTLDLSMGWAGPLVSEILAEMGAEVIKVEDTRYFDWWRGSLSIAPAEMQPIERAAPFNTANRGKLGVTLNLNDPRGVAILKKLIESSDVMLENFSPGVMHRMGLSYAEVAKINPRLIMCSLPAFASDGPEAQYRGYGMTIEAMSGVTGICGYHDSEQPYTLANALGDPVSGLHGALGVLAALRERQRTGRGQLVEVAEVETAVPFMAEAIIDYQLSGRIAGKTGNRHPRFAPYGIYRCADEDSWIAISVENEAQFSALIAALGCEQVVRDARFASMESRKRNEDELDRVMNEATSRCSAEELSRRLLAAGIAAGPISTAGDVLGDTQLAARDFFVPIERKVVGTHLYPGAVPRMSATPLSGDIPAPMLGEHNAEVLGRLAGIGVAELAELERAGVIGTKPIG